jgi:hypothetical protein
MKGVYMKRLGSIIGVLLAAMGILWILQGTDVLKTGAMAGHMQWAILGAIAFVVGLGLIALNSRRQHTA